MKYECKICNTVYCFDGSTEESLPHDITQHEKGENHKSNQNELLREKIVDLADLWDGVESSRYGTALQFILDELGIKDMPKFYGQPMKDMIDEIQRERKK